MPSFELSPCFLRDLAAATVALEICKNRFFDSVCDAVPRACLSADALPVPGSVILCIDKYVTKLHYDVEDWIRCARSRIFFDSKRVVLLRYIHELCINAIDCSLDFAATFQRLAKCSRP